MIVKTNNGPVELSAKAFALNIEIFNLKEHIRRQTAQLAKETDFIEIQQAAQCISENVRVLWQLEDELEDELED